MDKKSTEEEEVIFDSQAPLSNQDKVEENKELEEKPKPLNATWKAHKLEIQKEHENADNYMFKIPPDIGCCEKHMVANLMRRPLDDPRKAQICPCCHECYNRKPFPLCCNPQELASFGFGVTLYFQLLKSLRCILWAFLLPALFIIIFNITNGLTLDPNNHLKSDTTSNKFWVTIFIIHTTPGNIPFEDVYIGSLIQIFCFLLLYFFWVNSTRRLKNQATALDITELTPADYTIALVGLPRKDIFDQETFMRRYFYDKFGGTQRVKRVTFCYDIRIYKELADKLNISKMKKYIIEKVREDYKRKHPTASDMELMEVYPTNMLDMFSACRKREFPDYKKLCKAINDTEKLFERFEKAKTYPFGRADKAFITFTQTEDCEKALRMYGTTSWQRLFRRGAKIYHQGHSVYAYKANEPEDIKWENASVPTCKKFLWRLLTWIITFCLLSGCFVVNYFLNYVILDMKKDEEYNFYQIKALVFSTSLIIVINNTFLAIIISKLTLYEKHLTKTGTELSCGIKLIIAFFLNTAIIPLICTRNEGTFRENGLVMRIFYNWISIAFVQPFMEIFNIFYLPVLYRRWKVRSAGSKSTLTQFQANVKYGPPVLNVPYKYAMSVFILFFTTFYLPIFPLGVPFGLIALGTHYWANKYLFLRRYKKPNKVSQEIATYFMDIAGLSVILFLVSNTLITYIMLQESSEKESGIKHSYILPTIVGCGIFLTIVLLRSFLTIRYKATKFSKQSFSGCLLSLIDERVLLVNFENIWTEHPYDLHKFGKKDYMYYNPITRSQAIMEIVQAERTHTKDKERISELNNVLSQLSRTNAMRSLNFYSLGGLMAESSGFGGVNMGVSFMMKRGSGGRTSSSNSNTSTPQWFKREEDIGNFGYEYYDMQISRQGTLQPTEYAHNQGYYTTEEYSQMVLAAGYTGGYHGYAYPNAQPPYVPPVPPNSQYVNTINPEGVNINRTPAMSYYDYRSGEHGQMTTQEQDALLLELDDEQLNYQNPYI